MCVWLVPLIVTARECGPPRRRALTSSKPNTVIARLVRAMTNDKMAESFTFTWVARIRGP
jgi:hypothetical protein